MRNPIWWVLIAIALLGCDNHNSTPTRTLSSGDEYELSETFIAAKNDRIATLLAYKYGIEKEKILKIIEAERTPSNIFDADYKPSTIDERIKTAEKLGISPDKIASILIDYKSLYRDD